MSDNEHRCEGEAQRLQLSGMWKQESKTGKVYYSGSLGNLILQLWPNKFKESQEDRKPDLILYVVKRKPKPRPTEQTEGAKTDEEVTF